MLDGVDDWDWFVCDSSGEFVLSKQEKRKRKAESVVANVLENLGKE